MLREGEKEQTVWAGSTLGVWGWEHCWCGEDKSTLHLWGWEEQDTHENPTYTTARKSVQFINGFPPNDA